MVSQFDVGLCPRAYYALGPSGTIAVALDRNSFVIITAIRKTEHLTLLNKVRRADTYIAETLL